MYSVSSSLVTALYSSTTVVVACFFFRDLELVLDAHCWCYHPAPLQSTLLNLLNLLPDGWRSVFLRSCFVPRDLPCIIWFGTHELEGENGVVDNICVIIPGRSYVYI